jgi:hypothetical protein
VLLSGLQVLVKIRDLPVKLSAVSVGWHKSQVPVNQSCGPSGVLCFEVAALPGIRAANQNKPESNASHLTKRTDQTQEDLELSLGTYSTPQQ